MILEASPRGIIYKARFPDGQVARVKQVRSTEQGTNTFYKEVQQLGRLHHRHLVKLQGFAEGVNRFECKICAEHHPTLSLIGKLR